MSRDDLDRLIVTPPICTDADTFGAVLGLKMCAIERREEQGCSRGATESPIGVAHTVAGGMVDPLAPVNPAQQP